MQSPLYIVPALVNDRYADLLAQLPYRLVDGPPENDDTAGGGLVLYDRTQESLAALTLFCMTCRLPVIALVEDGDEESALEVGAHDSIPASRLTLDLLERVLRYAVEREHLFYQAHALNLARVRAEMRLTNLIDRNRDGVVVVDSDGIISYINPAAVDLFGRERNRLLGSSLGFSVVSGEVTEMEIRQKSGEIATVELQIMETEWEYRPAQLLSLRDVTARRAAEAEQREWETLVVALEKEKELSRIKTGFMTTLIHEFRTPLTIIQSASDLLYTYYNQLTEEKRRLRLDTIQTQVKQLDMMLGEIALTVHAELGQLAFNPAPLNLEQMCQKFSDDMRQTIGASHILVFDVDHSFDYNVMGDLKLLTHVIPNLLSNAIKYSSAGLEIDFRLYQDGNDLVISIADHGIGIPAEDQKHLFESFRRGSNVGEITGTGLGLKVVKDCVTAHKGTLTVDSTEGVGTTCTVRLPRIEINS